MKPKNRGPPGAPKRQRLKHDWSAWRNLGTELQRQCQRCLVVDSTEGHAPSNTFYWDGKKPCHGRGETVGRCER